MSKRILLATLLSLASGSLFGAGFEDSGAWPSEDNFTFQAYTSYIPASNVYAKAHSVSFDWSNDDGIGTLTNLALISYTVTNAWSEPFPPYTNGYGDVFSDTTNNGSDITFYAYNAPVNGGTNTVLITTNSWWSSIKVNAHSNEVASWSTSLTNDYEIVQDGSTTDVTVTHVIAGEGITLKTDKINVWAYDAYSACDERYRVLSDNVYRGEGNLTEPQLFRWPRDTLDSTKKWIRSNYYKFTDITNAVGGTYEDYLSTLIVTDTSTNYPTSIPVYDSWTNYCEYIGIPTNWHHRTPYQNLNGAQDGVGHIVTQTWVIISCGTNPAEVVTNAVRTYNGICLNIVGVNGAIVTTVVTNNGVEQWFYDYPDLEDCRYDGGYGDLPGWYPYWVSDSGETNIIAEGFTEGDYTFKLIPDAFEALIHIPADVVPVENTNYMNEMFAEGWGLNGVSESLVEPAWTNTAGCARGVNAYWNIETNSMPHFPDWPASMWDGDYTGDPYQHTDPAGDDLGFAVLTNYYSGYRQRCTYAFRVKTEGEADNSSGYGYWAVSLLPTCDQDNFCAFNPSHSCTWSDEYRMATPCGGFLCFMSTVVGGISEVYFQEVVYKGTWDVYARANWQLEMYGPTHVNIAGDRHLYAIGTLGFDYRGENMNGYDKETNFVYDADSYPITNYYTLLDDKTDLAPDEVYVYTDFLSTNLPATDDYQKGGGIGGAFGVLILDTADGFTYY